MVLVGETVEFDFILLDSFGRFVNAFGHADYAMAVVGGEKAECEPGLKGRFTFRHQFDSVHAGQSVNVFATAFRQRGRRDYVKIRGEWVRGESLYDAPDQAVASDSIHFTAYEAPIQLTIVRPPDNLEPETGVLTIRRSNGTSRSVYIDRPHRPGFTITGPEPDGYYRIQYLPMGEELNSGGTTEVEFVIYDTANQPHYASTTLETP